MKQLWNLYPDDREGREAATLVREALEILLEQPPETATTRALEQVAQLVNRIKRLDF